MAINYAERFEREIETQFKRELTSADLAENTRYSFIDVKTIKIPTITLSGYKDHSRDGSKNVGTVKNEWTPYALTHDRDITFYVDDMDVDETNQVLSAANITATFNTDQAIPETDAYRYSKIYADVITHGGTIDTTEITKENILDVFDAAMEAMDEAEVPVDGRRIKCTPKVYTMFKQAEKIQRSLDLGVGAENIKRNIRSIDDVQIDVVPSSRFMSAYDFAEGFKPATAAKQINFILYHNSAIVAPIKVADVFLWAKGETPESAFGHLYQNRSYQDLFVLKHRVDGVFVNAAA